MEKIFIDHHLLFFYNPPQSPFYKGGQRGIKGEKEDFPLLTRNPIKFSSVSSVGNSSVGNFPVSLPLSQPLETIPPLR
jgi:hypothetical protein